MDVVKVEEAFGVVVITADEVVNGMAEVVEIGVEVEATTVEDDGLGLAHPPLYAFEPAITTWKSAQYCPSLVASP